MKRKIYIDLLNWKSQTTRKPLILKGARQTGKTYILKEFGKNEFNHYHYINFLNNSRAKEIFEQGLPVSTILENLNYFFKSTIDIKNDLLIFDEIQECPKALSSLKKIFEEIPSLAI